MTGNYMHSDLYSRIACRILFFSVTMCSAFLANSPEIVFVVYTTVLIIILGTVPSNGSNSAFKQYMIVLIVFGVSNLLGNLVYPLGTAPPAKMLLVIAVLISGWSLGGVSRNSAKYCFEGVLLASIFVLGFYGYLLVDPSRFEFGRLGTARGESSSNLIGLNCYIIIVAAFAAGAKWIRALIAVPAAVTIVWAQSRTSMAVSGLFVVLNVWRTTPRRWRAYLIGAGGLALLAVVADSVGLLTRDSAILGYAERALLLSDPYRGLQTGFVGRERLWAETFDLFLLHPIIGVGLGQHQEVAELPLSGHSLYLITLAEGGIIGFSTFTILCGVGLLGLFRAFKRASSEATGRTSALGALFICCSYFIYGVLEPRGINIANAFSALFFFYIGLGWRIVLVPKHDERRLPPPRGTLFEGREHRTS